MLLWNTLFGFYQIPPLIGIQELLPTIPIFNFQLTFLLLLGCTLCLFIEVLDIYQAGDLVSGVGHDPELAVQDPLVELQSGGYSLHYQLTCQASLCVSQVGVHCQARAP